LRTSATVDVPIVLDTVLTGLAASLDVQPAPRCDGADEGGTLDRRRRRLAQQQRRGRR
jgi:hypothetical protein